MKFVKNKIPGVQRWKFHRVGWQCIWCLRCQAELLFFIFLLLKWCLWKINHHEWRVWFLLALDYLPLLLCLRLCMTSSSYRPAIRFDQFLISVQMRRRRAILMLLEALVHYITRISWETKTRFPKMQIEYLDVQFCFLRY